jgi:putative zinc finger protein
MNCREFRSNHVGFIDDVLSAADMAAMRRHTGVCARCSTLDVRIRRSLLVVRNLPQIEPSVDFYARLCEQLRTAPAPSATHRSASVAATFVVVTAALAAAVYFAMAIGVHRNTPIQTAPQVTVTALAERATPSISDAALVATVPAGVPVWPAMFMVGELPMHLANAELLDNGIGR